MFEGFSAERVKTSATEIFLRRAGHGPVVLLLHGYPQTHAIWHRVAPALREHFTVVCADLRGYGASGRPPSDPTHAPYSKRVMARDLAEVMEILGFTRFAVVGHDRGARVAYRLALDHPARVAALGVLDVSPTLDVWNRTDQTSALANFHWQLLAQPAPLPERLIGIDPEHEAGDRRAGRRITCPVLVLWGEGDAQSRRARFLDTWKQWADDVTGGGVACGHFIPEEAPTALLSALGPFLERALLPAGAAP